jgi:hypothetical protein
LSIERRRLTGGAAVRISSVAPINRCHRCSRGVKYFARGLSLIVAYPSVSLFLEHFDRIPRLVRRLLLILQSALEIHFGKKIVWIKFEKT